jgi:hypothetical protein
MIKRNLILTVVAVSVLSVAACGAMGSANDSQNQPFNDAPTVGNPDLTAARIYAMPDGFNNFAVKCIGGTAVITLYHGIGKNSVSYGAVTVSENSALCK